MIPCPRREWCNNCRAGLRLFGASFEKDQKRPLEFVAPGKHECNWPAIAVAFIRVAAWQAKTRDRKCEEICSQPARALRLHVHLQQHVAHSRSANQKGVAMELRKICDSEFAYGWPRLIIEQLQIRVCHCMNGLAYLRLQRMVLTTLTVEAFMQ